MGIKFDCSIFFFKMLVDRRLHGENTIVYIHVDGEKIVRCPKNVAVL